MFIYVYIDSSSNICHSKRQVIKVNFLGVPPSIRYTGNMNTTTGADIDLIYIVKEKLQLDNIEFAPQSNFADAVAGVRESIFLIKLI